MDKLDVIQITYKIFDNKI